MRTSFRKYQIAAIAVSAILAAGDVSHASIQTFGFYKITSDPNPNVASQLTVEVSDEGGPGTATFKFFNNVGTASSITDIYFDDGTLLALSTVTGSGAGVVFDTNVSPGDLSGGNDINPGFNVTQGFAIDSSAPGVMANGVNAASEWVKILFTLQGSQTYADTIASLADGSLRIGLHVQAIGASGGSDSYINLPPVPEATSVIVWSLLGAMGICYKVRRSRLG